jgi:single-stranded DNA-binding protein
MANPNANLVILMGTLVRDPHWRNNVNRGTCQFTVVNDQWVTDKLGYTRQRSSVIDCRMDGSTTKKFIECHFKGSPVYLEGWLATESWVDKATGQVRRRNYVQVRRWQRVWIERSGLLASSESDQQAMTEAAREMRERRQHGGPGYQASESSNDAD